MAYDSKYGRKPFERASKAAHSEIINNAIVQEFVARCYLPEAPPRIEIEKSIVDIPPTDGRITAVIAIDGGMTETFVREEFPSASIAFLTLGPLYFNLADLRELDRQVFIGPEDLRCLKNIDRYSLVLPTKFIRVSDAGTFARGVRRAIHQFLLQKDGHLMKALSWLLFREWRGEGDREQWEIPQCPNVRCFGGPFQFESGGGLEQKCGLCGEPVLLADSLRLYERIDEELGAGSVLSYLLTSLEQIVLVHLIRTVLGLKPSLLREILFVKDGPLAFFGPVAPLHRPMRDLMAFLAEEGTRSPLINLIGVEKSGPFVEHAALIEDRLEGFQAIVPDNEYVYRYVVPGDPKAQKFGRNTYYGAKIIFRGSSGDTYVGTIPTGDYRENPSLDDLFNVGEVVRATVELRCSMYDNALVPVALANKLVSLADVPSAEILSKFARKRLAGT